MHTLPKTPTKIFSLYCQTSNQRELSGFRYFFIAITKIRIIHTLSLFRLEAKKETQDELINFFYNSQHMPFQGNSQEKSFQFNYTNILIS